MSYSLNYVTMETSVRGTSKACISLTLLSAQNANIYLNPIEQNLEHPPLM